MMVVQWDLQGMINDLVKRSDYPIGDKLKDEVRSFRR